MKPSKRVIALLGAISATIAGAVRAAPVYIGTIQPQYQSCIQEYKLGAPLPDYQAPPSIKLPETNNPKIRVAVTSTSGTFLEVIRNGRFREDSAYKYNLMNRKFIEVAYVHLGPLVFGQPIAFIEDPDIRKLHGPDATLIDLENRNRFQQTFTQSVQLELKMARVIPSSRELALRVALTSKSFSRFGFSLTGGDTVELSVRAKLKSCDGQELSDSLSSRKPSLEDLVRNLVDTDLHRYLSCDLVPTYVALETPHRGFAIQRASLGAILRLAGDELIWVPAKAEVCPGAGKESAGQSLRLQLSGSKSSAEQDSDVLFSTAEEMAQMYSDYRDVLIQASRLAKNERLAVVVDYFSKEGAKLKQVSDRLRSKLQTAPLIDRISIHSSLVRLYGHIKGLEANVTQKFELDQVVNRWTGEK